MTTAEMNALLSRYGFTPVTDITFLGQAAAPVRLAIADFERLASESGRQTGPLWVWLHRNPSFAALMQGMCQDSPDTPTTALFITIQLDGDDAGATIDQAELPVDASFPTAAAALFAEARAELGLNIDRTTRPA